MFFLIFSQQKYSTSESFQEICEMFQNSCILKNTSERFRPFLNENPGCSSNALTGRDPVNQVFQKMLQNVVNRSFSKIEVAPTSFICTYCFSNSCLAMQKIVSLSYLFCYFHKRDSLGLWEKFTDH